MPRANPVAEPKITPPPLAAPPPLNRSKRGAKPKNKPKRQPKRRPKSGRRAHHTDEDRIDQLPNLKFRPGTDQIDERESSIVTGEHVSPKGKQMAELAFMEEPVTIIINPSSDPTNPNTFFEAWCNGEGAQIWMEDQREWLKVTYLPIDQPITIKRKILEIIVRAKVNKIKTEHEDSTVEKPRNTERRTTTAVHSYSVIEDRNPRGRSWLSAIARRNF